MNFESIAGNVIAAFIYAGIVYVLKRLYLVAAQKNSKSYPEKPSRKKV